MNEGRRRVGVLDCACCWRRSDERGNGGGARVRRSNVHSVFCIPAREPVVTIVGVASKTISPSFYFNRIDRDSDVGLVRKKQQSTSGLD